MDALDCVDNDKKTRATIERCEQVYADSDIGFFDAFTNLGSGEKQNRLREKDGRVIAPSDQPVMYATAMLKLRRDNGGDDWVKRYLHLLRKCPAIKATDESTAIQQSLNWLVCASAAAGKDLSPVFADRWRMPVTKKQREILATTNFQQDDFDPKVVIAKLTP